MTRPRQNHTEEKRALPEQTYDPAKEIHRLHDQIAVLEAANERTIDLEMENAQLRTQLDAYFNDPSQVVSDLREECNLVAESRNHLAIENDRLRSLVERTRKTYPRRTQNAER